jgi:hypothetical protein
MKSSTNIIAYSLAIISICRAEPYTSNNVESRTDGMVNIGGVLYPEDEMKDSEKRRKAELAIERIEQLKKIESMPRDYSEISTSALLTIVLGTTGNVRFKDDLKKLSERPVETREAIDNFLKNEKPFHEDLLFFSRLPSVAKMLGTDYEVEVTKRILNHPLAKKHDQILFEDKSSSMAGGGLFNHLASSDKDETETLDGLIQEGRVERGSELEIKWRKLLSKAAHSEKRPMRDTQDGNEGISGSNLGNKRSNRSLDRNGNFLPTVITASIFLVALGLLIWRKIE